MKRRDRDIYKTLGIPIAVASVVFMIILLNGMASLRIKELKLNLQKIGTGGVTRSNMALLAKYNQFEKGDFAQNNSISKELVEAELMGILANEIEEDIKIIGLSSYVEIPILSVVNFLSYLFGSAAIKSSKNDEKISMLFLGSFYERKRDYLNAVKIFSTGIELFDKERDKLGFLFLHRGFCFAMLGEFEKAVSDYEAAVSLRENYEEGAIAEILLVQLKERKEKTTKIDKRKTSLKKGLEYYKLMAYTQAIETFNEIEKKKKPTKSLHFHRGRAYEEIGFVNGAVKDYQKVVKKYPKSSYAKKAYRRLYILGAYYQNNQKLKEKAEQKLAKLGDESFIKKSQDIENIVDVDAISKLPKTDSMKNAIETVIKKTNAGIKSVEKPAKQLTVKANEQNNNTDNNSQADEISSSENDDFLGSLSKEIREERKDITFIQKDLKNIENILKKNKQALEKEEELLKKELKKRKEKEVHRIAEEKRKEEEVRRIAEEKKRVEAQELAEKKAKQLLNIAKQVADTKKAHKLPKEAKRMAREIKRLKKEQKKARKIAKKKKKRETQKLAKKKAKEIAKKEKKKKGIALSKKTKRSDKEILFDPKTSPEKRKKIIKKLYAKVTKIITIRKTYIGHIIKENSSMIWMITPDGEVSFNIGEIGIRLKPGDSKILLK